MPPGILTPPLGRRGGSTMVIPCPSLKTLGQKPLGGAPSRQGLRGSCLAQSRESEPDQGEADIYTWGQGAGMGEGYT